MGPIKNISGMPGNVNKAEKNSEYKKIESERQKKKNDSVSSSSQKDSIEISPEARDLLTKNVEANDPRFVKDLIDAETLDASELSIIQNRIQENYYSNPEVIDQIVDKLFELPYFSQQSSSFDE